MGNLIAWGAKAARNKEIVALIAAGKTLGEIGLVYGLTRERVRQIGERVGVTSINRTNNPLTESEKARARELIDRGMPVDHVAESVGRGRTSVRNYLVDAGLHVPLNDDRAWKPREDAFLRRRYKTPGWSAAAIGEHLGRTRDEVIGRAHRLGLSDPTYWRKASARKRKLQLAMAHMHKLGRTYAQISAELGVPVGTVNVYLWQHRQSAA